MNNSILFSHSYFMRFDPKQWSIGQPYAPLGTLYAAALMREKGYEVSLFDTMFSHKPEEAIEHLEKVNPKFFVLYDDGFNYLTKMCLTNMREAAFKMIHLAKEKGCLVILSSSDATDRFELYLNEGADFVIIGEAELTLSELIDSIQKGDDDFYQIHGLAFKHNNSVVKTTGRSVMKELDKLPFPAWDIIDMEPYRQSWIKNAGYFSMNMATTRGCPFKCNWCAKPIYGNRYNTRSPQNVTDELKMLKAKYDFDHIWFCDDILGLKPGWVKTFADCIQKENVAFKFKMQGRVDLLLQENNIKDLARAGCDNIWMGAESGSQKILDAMDKRTTVKQIFEATRLLKKNNIKPSFFIQFGYPGETSEDIEKTIAMINKLLPYEIGISVSYPLPGTVFYEKVKSQLKEKTNWTDSDEMALMFQNTYHPAFYKQLHSYVHKSYRKHLSFENWKQLFAHPFAINFAMLKKAMSGLYYIPAAFIEKKKITSTGKILMNINSNNETLAATAFSKQAKVFDELYSGNTIIQYKRKRVREHLKKFLLPGHFILELNSGTGEDAIWLARQNCKVHATDISTGMQEILKQKIKNEQLENSVNFELCSFTRLNELKERGPYDMIFSNFAGLNCTEHLNRVLSSFSSLLQPKGIVTLVMLPKFCLWEFLLIFKGKFKTATRRFFIANGRNANVEATQFKCWYYNSSFIKKYLKDEFEVVSIEGLCTLVPPSYVENFAEKHPKTYDFFKKNEDKLKSKRPWKYIGDYYIISLQKK